MNTVLFLLGSVVIGLIRILPLTWVARLGRAGGRLAFRLDRRHRRVAERNIAARLNLSPGETAALAFENFCRIGEAYACGIKTAFMNSRELEPHLEIVGGAKLPAWQPEPRPRNCILAIGHFGNFELYTRIAAVAPGYRGASTYRGLRQPGLNRLLLSLRRRSGCLFFERRAEARALRAEMSGAGLLLGLLADQHAGAGGLRLPFFGMECSSSAAPAVLALRYQCPLHTAICFRVGLARWRIEIGDQIATHEHGQPRPKEDITRDVNRALEAAVRRDPANWFWVHDRWKPSACFEPQSEHASGV